MVEWAENGQAKVNHWFMGDFQSKYMQSEPLFVNIAGLSAAAFKLLIQNID